MKITFFGSSKYVIPIIEVLQKNFSAKGGLALVVTTEKSPSDPVPFSCSKNNISFLSVSNLSDPNLKSLILNLKSPLAVLADFGLFVPEEILNLFSKGIINIHPSLLPKYRGPTPVQTAILNGEKETGVSIIKLDNEIDHGPILEQVKVQILPQDTAQTLYERLFKKGAEMLPNILYKYLKGNLKLITQNHKNATFTKHLSRADGYIDISYNKLSADKLQRMIRAYFPWPGVWTRLRLGFGGQAKLKIIKFLPGEKIQVEGKKTMPYKDFINGYPSEGKELLSKLNLY